MRETLPPWHALPDDLPIPDLPAVGQSWYDHGPGYWPGRVWATLVCTFCVGIWVVLTAAVLTMTSHASRLAFYVELGVEVVYSAGIGVYIGVRTVRQWRDPAVPVRAARGWRSVSAAPAGRESSGPGVSSGPGSAAGKVLYGCGWLFVGFYLALLITTLLPETVPEHRARLWMADRLRQRGLLQAGPAAS